MTRIYYLVLIISAISLFQSGVFAQANPTLISKDEFDVKTMNYKGQQAFQDLLTTKTFTLQSFGAAAAPFHSTERLADLLREKEAERALQLVAKKANPEGQIYALIGLQILKSKSFEQYFEDFKKHLNKNKIEFISSEDGGCDSEHLALKKDEVIKKLESGEFTGSFLAKFPLTSKSTLINLRKSNAFS